MNWYLYLDYSLLATATCLNLSSRCEQGNSSTIYMFSKRWILLDEREYLDTKPRVSFLSTCTSILMQQDWCKFVWLLSFLQDVIVF